MKLISWVQNAFESQFFITTSPRGKAGILNKTYSFTYKVFKKLGLYNLLANIVNFIFLKEVKLSSKNLLKKKLKKFPFSKFKLLIIKLILRNYRSKNFQLLKKYGSL